MWRKLAIVPLLLVPVACVGFLIQQGYIKVGFLEKKPETPGLPPLVETFEIKSEQNGKTYPITVQLPPDYKSATASYPVVFATDNRENPFKYQAVVEPLVKQKKSGGIILVGIGKGKAAPGAKAAPAERTGSAFTARARQRHQELAVWLDDITHSTQQYGDQDPTGGQAPAFIAFIEKELIPKIESQYRTLPAERTLAGHGLGALFALETAIAQPQVFPNYLVIVPKVEYAQFAPLDMIKEKLAGDYDPKIQIFTIIGADDNPTHMGGYQRLLEIMKAKKFTSLDFHSEILANQDHNTIIAPGAQMGLKYLIQNP